MTRWVLGYPHYPDRLSMVATPKLCYAAYHVTRSTSEERVSCSRQIELTQWRTPRSHLMSLRSRLGKAAAIGGRAYVERVATSDEFAAIFCHGLDPKSRKAAIDMVVRIAERTRADPPPRKAPSRDERVKIRWTDQLIQQFVAEAPRSSDDFDLCRRLGLPSYCRVPCGLPGRGMDFCEGAPRTGFTPRRASRRPWRPC